MPSLRIPESPARERLAAAVGGLVILVILLAVLSGSRPRLAATNTRVLASGLDFTVQPGQERCQSGESVPQEASSLRLYVSTFDRPTGPPLEVSIRDSAGGIATSAQIPGGYRPGVLHARIPQPDRDVASGSFCLRNAGTAPAAFAGNFTGINPSAFNPEELKPPSGEGIRVDYFREGSESWFELGPDIAHRFAQFKPSFFRSWTMWVVLAALFLLYGAAAEVQCRSSWSGAVPTAAGERGSSASGARKVVRRARHRALRWLPAAGWACAAIATANAAVWAGVTPAFQVPDETSHVGYAQYLAETGRPPSLKAIEQSDDPLTMSDEYMAVLRHLPFTVEGKPSWSSRQDDDLRVLLERSQLSRRQELGGGGATRYSPLYYALEAVPMRAGARLDAIDRLFAMRLVPPLFAGITVAFAFLFLRELFPGTPWSWTLGALAIALQPVFGFMSGGVNNDNLLWPAAAALIYLMARAFRRGLSPGLGLAMGVTGVVGFLAKPSMLSLLPGAAFGVFLMVWRGQREHRRRAVLGAGAAAAAFLMPTLTWLALETTLLNRPLGATTGALSTGSLKVQPSLVGQASYLWQFFLPKLPFMEDAFGSYPDYPVWDVYIRGFIGRFGWFQYGFPIWANQLGLAVLIGVGAAAAVALVKAGPRVRGRWAELSCHAVMALGVLALNGIAGYRSRLATGIGFEQPRYLFPVLALYGAVVALAARAGGRRWGPSVAAFLVVLAAGHSLFAMLVTVGRYYA
ncbi:MAG: DUF2142 domain-containing protein [Actinomycetota bacterium]|nr:DUF2142 domain-containing protein [Actinomycetota bacterium]